MKRCKCNTFTHARCSFCCFCMCIFILKRTLIKSTDINTVSTQVLFDYRCRPLCRDVCIVKYQKKLSLDRKCSVARVLAALKISCQYIRESVSNAVFSADPANLSYLYSGLGLWLITLLRS